MKHWKQEVCLVLILFWIVWPALQFVLCKTLEFNPWKLCGFGMYSVPWVDYQYGYLGVRDGKFYPLDVETDPALRERVARFHGNRWVFGRLADPAGVMRAIMQQRQDLDGVQVNIAKYVVNRETAILEHEITNVRLMREHVDLPPRKKTGVQSP
jgi:hypothetical protein